jgi:hypothetical protein
MERVPDLSDYAGEGGLTNRDVLKSWRDAVMDASLRP